MASISSNSIVKAVTYDLLVNDNFLDNYIMHSSIVYTSLIGSEANYCLLLLARILALKSVVKLIEFV